jgi:hypothetical protein
MNRTTVVFLAGVCAAVVGAFLAVRAGGLATQWQPLGAGSWGGTTNVALRQAYHELGLLSLGLGAALLVVAAWNWLSAASNMSGPPPVFYDPLPGP